MRGLVPASEFPNPDYKNVSDLSGTNVHGMRLTPIGEEDERLARMNDDGTWLCQVICNDHGTQQAIKCCHFDAFGAGIGEKYQIMDPINGDSAWRLEAPFYDIFYSSSIHVRHFDDICRYV